MVSKLNRRHEKTNSSHQLDLRRTLRQNMRQGGEIMELFFRKPKKNKRFIQTDDKIYTSAGISAGIDLSFHVVEQLHGKEVAKNTASYMEYKGYQ